jgi:PPK2 family polyphosphate:nucleotide phosphotransferase
MLGVMSLIDALRVEPGSKVNLAKLDPGDTHKVREGVQTDRDTDQLVDKIGRHVHILGADKRFALLIVLQGMDTSGKDGAIRRVFAAVDPQFIRVATFKRPSDDELAHDFLWRIHSQTPRRGEMVIFNRSHYEDVGIVRVHSLVPKDVWSERYGHINDFEEMLVESSTVVVKFFLHISRDEQKKRLESRLKDPTKNWKMDMADLEERKHWKQYMEAYSDALSRCSSKRAPWYVIPADHKWFRSHAIATVVEQTLADLKLRYPRPSFDPARVRIT